MLLTSGTEGKLCKSKSSLESLFFQDVAENWGDTDLSDAIRDFTKTIRFQKKRYNNLSLPGILGEFSLRNVLRRIGKKHGCAEFPKIEPGAITDDGAYIFYQNGGWLIKSNRLGAYFGIDSESRFEDYGEIDDVMIINGLPIIFEIKLMNRFYGGGVYGRKGNFPWRKKKGVANTLSRERMEHITRPFRLLFSSEDIGYACVIYPEQMSNGDNPIQQQFLSDGGILLPFCFNREEYLDKIRTSESELEGLRECA